MGYELENTCGNQTYQVIGPAQKFVSVAHEAGSKSFAITIDASNLTEAGEYFAEIDVSLDNYPSVTS